MLLRTPLTILQSCYSKGTIPRVSNSTKSRLNPSKNASSFSLILANGLRGSNRLPLPQCIRKWRYNYGGFSYNYRLMRARIRFVSSMKRSISAFWASLNTEEASRSAPDAFRNRLSTASTRPLGSKSAPSSAVGF